MADASATLGMSNPLSVAVTSSAADGSGVMVLIPTCEEAASEIITDKKRSKIFCVMILLLKCLFLKMLGLMFIRLRFKSFGSFKSFVVRIVRR